MTPIPGRHLLFLLAAALVQPAAGQLTLEDIFLHEKYTSPPYRVDQWMEGGAAFLRTSCTGGDRVIHRVDAATGHETVSPVAQWLAAWGDGAPAIGQR